ncbi:hypothetical protein VOLCADRAFT_92229 [Volvox carteri f. nagariensis]|uniref:Trypsin-like peptidase domain-containing protein n=1 Tax=Volvox carteri f. nagariensis TaxID=3068 RepID=D8TZ38_VOLCA|nr:uncharacterized protein VOLCADRAFT_92229 [Volvox carteri f. nagariensis]EFJ47113.1 hypothetical protein VOLCADRAFT_92229 [Volvox carteri f. nagariensis]|eukprot:XP_002951662.1 hypothetical protein VOLCADRAFT_92229 [Volvox carteri f. nagariensis]
MSSDRVLDLNLDRLIDPGPGDGVRTALQELCKLIFNRSKNLVVKIVGCKRRQESTSDLEPVIYLNGFFYSNSDPYILTCAHGLKSGATDFFALMSDGSAFNDQVPIKLEPTHPPQLHGAMEAVGDSTYMIGFAGRDAPQLSSNSGTISSVGFMGYSGSPILNMDGFLIGMVQAGHDPNGSKQVTAIPAQGINMFLQTCGDTLPGIKV